MAVKRVWTVINFSLVFIALLLFLNLLNVQFTPLGKSTAQLQEEGLCLVKNWAGELVPREDLSSCCLEKNKFTFSCQRAELEQYSWRCLTGNQIEYWFNDQGYRYCQRLLR